MKKYYDPVRRRLIYVAEKASPEFWDEHWLVADFQRAVRSTPNSWVARITRQYLSEGSVILEGGCGQANHVYALEKYGFNVIGVDSARLTVEKVHESAPDLQIEVGDVRELRFESDYFDGYWSRGLIEHYWNGFDSISLECSRVLRKGGYLFLTFPCMSMLRRWKARQNRYLTWEHSDAEPFGFYQFALNPLEVKRSFEDLGFKLIRENARGGLKGIRDETLLFHSSLQKLYDSEALSAKVAKKCINQFADRWFGHIRFMIMQKI